ncbi:MAG: hypothetical protein JWP59_1123 [Massilia sp.]|nr:hypothetical protein [Massilia sp.]
MRAALRRAAAAIVCASMAACGGGGSSPAPTPAPAPAAAASVTLSATPATVNVGQQVTLGWSSQNTGAASCTASGAWSGQQSASGTATVTAAAPAAGFGGAPAASISYTLTCGGTAASASVTVNAPAPANLLAITVDAGPAGAGNQVNLPYVSVTVCRPGTSVCATIDHVLVDTGSYGLRLLASTAQALALPAVLAPSGAAAGECGQFIGGHTWGSVVRADVRLGGESAAALPLQLMGDTPGGAAATPAACASIGENIGTLTGLGANGILGVGMLRYDCGAACVSNAIGAAYYSCAASGCVASRMPLASQVSNPVAGFAVDNNGVLLRLPSVGSGGAASVAGSLIFGINTQANNAIAGETTFRADKVGNFTTIYKGVTMSASFIDSGSNGIFFDDDSIAVCEVSTGFYCPPATLALSATTVAADGSAARTIDFSIDNVESLGNGIHVGNVGGPGGSVKTGANNAFDWGLPFFFGRRVFVGMESGAASGYWAY